MPKNSLDTLLDQVAKLTGIPDLATDEEGFCLIQIDEQLDLSIEYHEDFGAVVLSITCGKLPQEPSIALLQEILEANYYWMGSGGGTLAINGIRRTLDLQFREPLDHLDAGHLKDLMEAMVINAEVWQQKLNAVQTPAGASSQPEGLSSYIQQRA